MLRSEENAKNNRFFGSKLTVLNELILKMLKPRDTERPTCDKVLSKFKSCEFTFTEVKNDRNYMKNVNQIQNQLSNNFFNNYFEEIFSETYC